MEIPAFKRENIEEVCSWLRSMRPGSGSPVVDHFKSENNWLEVDNDKFPVTHFSLGLLFSLVDHDLNDVDSKIGFNASKIIGYSMRDWGISTDKLKKEMANRVVNSFSQVIVKMVEDNSRTQSAGNEPFSVVGPFVALSLIGGEGWAVYDYYYDQMGSLTKKVLDKADRNL